MPKVHHVKKAKKDNAAVKKGEPYYYWTFRYGGKRMSATYPKRSQLTQSAFRQAYYDLQDRIEAMGKLDYQDLQTAHQEILDEIDTLAEEAQDSLENIPEHLQESHMLNERVEMIEDWKSSFESVEVEIDVDELRQEMDTEDMEKEDVEIAWEGLLQERIDEIVEELISADPGIE